MPRPYDTSTLTTIISGARLLAASQDLDPETMEGIVRKAANIARENMLQAARLTRANDKD